MLDLISKKDDIIQESKYKFMKVVIIYFLVYLQVMKEETLS